MPDWLIALIAHTVFWIGIPVTLFASIVGPFVFVRKILKRKFTVLNVLGSVAVAVGLLALVFYLLYWAFALLQGVAFCQLYSDYTIFQCLLPSQRVIGG